MSKRYFTSESVTEGHPDKICDQVSDSILDEIIGKDPMARVACETAVTTGMVLVMGEITTRCYVDIPKIVRETIREIGYNRAKYGFDSDTCAVITSINEQSPDIALGVDKALEAKEGGMWEAKPDAGHAVNPDEDYAAKQEADIEATGAGDQGMMFGFACDETPELMPMPISLAHGLTRKLSEIRKKKVLPYLRPDGKSQVTVEYEDERPVRVDTVIISTQHSPDVDHDTIVKDVTEHIIKAVIPSGMIDSKTRILVNPTGRFVVGGPQGDSGLTGRKIIADTYGGYARHGGGAFSGKDPTKVDRSASYAARYVAKNIVAAGIARKCEVQVAYAIGVAKPVSVFVDTCGTGKIPDGDIVKLINRHFDLRPAAIIKKLDLRKPIYAKTAAYGHFGRTDAEFTWEKTDMADILRKDTGLA